MSKMLDRKFIYLDNAATSFPKPPAVLEAYANWVNNQGVSPGRSGHPLAVLVGQKIYAARELVADFFSFSDSLRVIFTKNVTESLNIALSGLSLLPGDTVITSKLEHNSMARPLSFLSKQGINVVSINPGFSPEDFLHRLKQHLHPKVKLFAFTHASNVTGLVFPITQIGQIAKEHNIPFLVDAAQTAGHLSINMEESFIDILAFTGHKSLWGPQGTGGLLVGERVELAPLIRGGTGSYSEHDWQPHFLPDALESGTPNTPGILGLAEGIRYIESIGMEQIREREHRIFSLLLDGLSSISNLTLYTPNAPWDTVPLVSINASNMSCSQLAQRLGDDYGICTRPGLHCAPWAHALLGTSPHGTLRLSPNYFTTEEDILSTVNAIEQIASGNPL